VVFLSVGYGKDAHGKLAMSFGPLNQEGGWRRLNVLVTRARERCVLFSSIRASDLDLSKTQARGVAALKGYLHLAEHGSLPAASAPKADHDSPLEAAIAVALREHGHEVHAQVGAAGFAIDLAVVDPEQKGRYVVGVECDGATYHSSPTARDRDRLREDVLRRLGWTIVRVWSTDWYRRPERTLERLLARIEAARSSPVAAPPEPPPPAHAAAAAAPRADAGPGPGPEADPEPEASGAPPVAASPEQAIVESLRSHFGIRHDGLLRAAARRLGYERLGPKIRAELDAALERLVAERTVTRDAQGFLVLEKTAP
jgi:very-short-patch-repair endonuclease